MSAAAASVMVLLSGATPASVATRASAPTRALVERAKAAAPARPAPAVSPPTTKTAPGLEPSSERAAFLFLLDDIPVGSVELTLTGTPPRFRYRAEHWLSGDAGPRLRATEVELAPVEDGRAPSALWLWRRPAVGCRAVIDERTRRTGEGCVDTTQEELAEGTLLGARFRAWYDEDGRLDRLELGPSRFVHVRRTPAPRAPPDFLGEAIPVVGDQGVLALEGVKAPPLWVAPEWTEAAARQLGDRVRASFTDPRPGLADSADDPRVGTRGGCLAHARRFERLARREDGHPRAAIVFGFYAAEGDSHARAHAWIAVRTSAGTLELDPTLDVVVTRATHLILGTAAGPPLAGERYLSVFQGRARLVRQRPHSGE